MKSIIWRLMIMKRIIKSGMAILLSTAMMIGCPIPVNAFENVELNYEMSEGNNIEKCSVSTNLLDKSFVKEKVDNQESMVIDTFINCIDEHDYKSIVQFYVQNKVAEMREFLDENTNRENHIGIFNVISAKLIECAKVQYIDVDAMLYDEYVSEPDVYVIGLDVNVYEDTKYFYQGINYFLVAFVNENGEQKISEMISIAEPQELLAKGYSFSVKYNVAINVMNERKNGNYVNGNGKKYDSINGDVHSSSNKLSFGILAVKNKRTVPTDSTEVRYKDSKGKINNIKFHDYCVGVLAGELRGATFDGEVRKAQAIAIKTFTWHYVIVPQNPTLGYDLTYASQSYVPDKVSENAKVQKDYDSVKDVWMESYGGAIFAAYYKKGKYEDQSSLKNGGEFKQEGARWLYKNKVATTYKALLKYYYDDSSASTGGAIRFFDSKKKEL